MVEGFFRTGRDNCHHHPFQISENVTRLKTHCSKSAHAQRRISAGIMVGLLPRSVDRAIDLDCQPRSEAGKIETVCSDRMLASEFVAAGAQSQCAPQADLGGISRPAVETCGFDDLATGVEDPSTMFHMVPLPVPGRFWILDHRGYILNTPNDGRSGIGALRQAARARPSTSRVWAGSMMPSSHSRAVACHGLPCAS